MIIVEASSLCSPLGTSGSPTMSGILNTVVGGGRDGWVGLNPFRYIFSNLSHDSTSIHVATGLQGLPNIQNKRGKPVVRASEVQPRLATMDRVVKLAEGF